jgi:hypothetical protein
MRGQAEVDDRECEHIANVEKHRVVFAVPVYLRGVGVRWRVRPV